MSLGTRALGRLLRLPRARTHDVRAEHDLPAEMPDGAILLADRYYPAADPRAPVVLMRSPYGRGGALGGLLGGFFAERGFQAVIQSCRGKHGSGGEFDPFRSEAADGRATLEWLERRPWFPGVAGTYGASYLGLTQWSVAADYPEWVKAMATAVTASDFHGSVLYPEGVFALEGALGWGADNVESATSFREARRRGKERKRLLPEAFRTLPLSRADSVAGGRPIPFFQEWVARDEPGDPWWDAMDFSSRRAEVRVPVSMVAGWYDLFVGPQLADYRVLRDAGVPVRLTVGPWGHGDLGLFGATLRDALDWLTVHLLGGGRVATPVRTFVLGSGRWAEPAAWPPVADPREWHLHPGGRLDAAPPLESEPDRYRFDPSDPTPSAGGAVLAANRGPKDQKERESRPDVLTYTGEPLARPLTIAGEPCAHLHLESSLRHTDFFVTLCDVDGRGRSVNLTTGIAHRRDVETSPAEPLAIKLAPTVAEFKAGHRIRLQIASASFPHYARNPGTGEPLAIATTLVPADQAVHHDPAHPSRLVLPEASL